MTRADDLRTGCRITLERMDIGLSLEGLSRAVSTRNEPVIFGGNKSDSPQNRFSYFGFDPVEILEIPPGDEKVFTRLANAIDRYQLSDINGDKQYEGHFMGGWAGFFSYDMKDAIEKIPRFAADDMDTPWVRLAFYDKIIAYDHRKRHWYLCRMEFEGQKDNCDQKRDSLYKVLRQGQTFERSSYLPVQTVTDYQTLDCNMTPQQYETAMKKIQQYIYDGEVYQINFSQRFSCPFHSPAIELFLWQNQCNPSPYACYLDAGGYQVVSASPELFLHLDHGRLETRPIKGTRKRILDGPGAKKKNEQNAAELLNCEKEKAELNMVIDLERNDLTRVCEYGTIRVCQPRHIETYPTVLHAVAAVEGKLRGRFDGRTFCDIIRGMFPGGSITGAPKIRAMEIIEELEPTKRGIYTGSMGYIGLGERMALNIAIRTIIIRNGRAFAQTGGGIVADSVTESEWQETLTKAHALIAGLEAVGQTGL